MSDSSDPQVITPEERKLANTLLIWAGASVFLWFFLGIFTLIAIGALAYFKREWLKQAIPAVQKVYLSGSSNSTTGRGSTAPKELSDTDRRAIEELDSIDPNSSVRGVYEAIISKNATMMGIETVNVVFDKSYLSAVQIGLIRDFFVVRMEDASSFKSAFTMPFSSRQEVMNYVDLENMNSIELISQASYFGSNANAYGIDLPSHRRREIFEVRHPKLSRNKAGGIFLDDNALWVVYGFMKDGSRPVFTQTFDYGLAVRIRTQLMTMFDSWRSTRTAQRAIPTDTDKDYL